MLTHILVSATAWIAIIYYCLIRPVRQANKKEKHDIKKNNNLPQGKDANTSSVINSLSDIYQNEPEQKKEVVYFKYEEPEEFEITKFNCHKTAWDDEDESKNNWEDVDENKNTWGEDDDKKDSFWGSDESDENAYERDELADSLDIMATMNMLHMR